MSNSAIQAKFMLCIPTYQRADLVRLLVQDIFTQTLLPQTIIVVDGNAKSRELKDQIRDLAGQHGVELVYLPSNHGNLPYQRYLGWLYAQSQDAEYLLYFDDDLRLVQADSLEKLLTPLLRDADILGMTAPLHEPASVNIASIQTSAWSQAMHYKAGSLRANGERVAVAGQADYEDTEWLYGRIMLYRMSALTQECFSDALFASYQRRLGKAEDTCLSHRVALKGRLQIANRVWIDHPNADEPRAYPTQAFQKARSIAYSRRLLNDTYRGAQSPTLQDRFLLGRAYVANLGGAWLRALRTRDAQHLSYARGYTVGAWMGIFQAPSAKRLTPEINWWQSAQDAFREAEILHPNHGA